MVLTAWRLPRARLQPAIWICLHAPKSKRAGADRCVPEELADNVKQNSRVAATRTNWRMPPPTWPCGGAVVAKVVHTMEAINTSSSKIADIIGLIDGIAFQTNILALNAAVKRRVPVSRGAVAVVVRCAAWRAGQRQPRRKSRT